MHKILMISDLLSNEYVKNENFIYLFLFIYLTDLPEKKFYPTVAAVYGNTEISMVYLGAPLDG